MTYTVLADALIRTKERCGATTADDGYLTELLTLSAGKAGSVTHYRVFFVAAKWLEQNRAQQALSKADGAEFTGLAKPIASLLNMQAAYDAANELTVPKGFEAISTEAIANQTQRQTARFGTRSHTPTVQP